MFRSGFTLIELMIVIAIIAILAGLSIIPYTNYMRKAKAKELMTFARACVQEAVAQCMTDPTFTGFDDLDACQNPPNTTYITGMTFTTLPSSCSQYTTTIQGTVGGETYQVTCTYNATAEDVICSAPRRI